MSILEKVKELRDLTGAGIQDCKTALSENNEDIDLAIEFLRKMLELSYSTDINWFCSSSDWPSHFNEDYQMKNFRIRISNTQVWLIDIEASDLNSALDEAEKDAKNIMSQTKPDGSSYIVRRDVINDLDII